MDADEAGTINKSRVHHSKTGKGTKWTALALESIDEDWTGDLVADGEGLNGEVRFKKGKVLITFKYEFKIKDEQTGKRKTAKILCGKFPSDTLVAIRESRDEARKLVNQGIDPRIHKKATEIEAQAALDKIIRDKEDADNANKTVEDLYNEWLDIGVKRDDGNKNIKSTLYKNIISVIGKIKVRDLKEEDLRNVIKAKIATGEIVAANELLSLVKQMFKWADLKGKWRRLMIDGNPAAPIFPKEFDELTRKKFTKVRTRVLNAFEIWQLQHIFKTYDADYQKIPDDEKRFFDFPLKKEYQLAVWIALSTLCRVGELSMAEWSHIRVRPPKKNAKQEEKKDWHENKYTWRIPKENTKGEFREHTVFISKFTYDLLQELRTLSGNSKWLFPSTRSTSCITDKVITHRIRERQVKFTVSTSGKPSKRKTDNALVIGNEKWVMHDLRRTGATMMQSLGIPHDIINLCQNHEIGISVEKNYFHFKYADARRDATEKLGDKLKEILSITDLRELDNYPQQMECHPDLETKSDEDDGDDGWGGYIED